MKTGRLRSAGTAEPFGTIVTLLVLTAQRRGEIAGLRSEWIDRTNNVVTLPKLSITHIFRADVDTDLDVGEAGQAAPHDNAAGRWIAGSREVAAEARQLREVVR